MSLFGKKTYNYITNEIDYEKLAKAIVKANEEIEEKKQKKPSFFTRVIAGCLLGLFFGLGLIATALIFIFIYVYVQLGCKGILSTLVGWKLFRVHFLLCTVILVLIVITPVLFALAVEFWREKDRSYIMSAFSGTMGFLAVIIAAIALLQQFNWL